MSEPQIPEPLYLQILQYLPIACVDVAIVDQGRVLLIQRLTPPAEHEWWLPGGRVQKGEKMREAAQRKALAEVGIRCQIGPLIYTGETLFRNGPKGVPVHTINSCFLGYPLEAQPLPQIDSAHQYWQWVDQIPEGLHPYIQECLIAAGLPRKD